MDKISVSLLLKKVFLHHNYSNISVPSISSPIAFNVASVAYALKALSGLDGMHTVDAFSPAQPFNEKVGFRALQSPYVIIFLYRPLRAQNR